MGLKKNKILLLLGNCSSLHAVLPSSGTAQALSPHLLGGSVGWGMVGGATGPIDATVPSKGDADL